MVCNLLRPNVIGGILVNNLIFSIIVNAIIIITFSFYNLDNLDYYIVSLSVTGFLVFYHVILYVKKADYYSPVGVVSVVMYYFFFIAPLLHINYDYYYSFFYESYENWFDSYNDWTFLNLIGVVIYYGILHYFNIFKISPKKKKLISFLNISKNHFIIIITILLLTSLAFQLIIYSKFGGVKNYIVAKEIYGLDAYDGLGKYALVAESFPIMLVFLLAFMYRNRVVVPYWEVIVIIVAFIIVKFFFGGFSGSRSNIVWSLFWCVGIITFFIKKIGIKFYLISLLSLVAFMLVYGVYKKHGTEFINVVQSEGIKSNNYKNENTNSVLLMSLMTDFSRADIQTFSIYSQSDGTYENLRLGETYLASILIFLPKSIVDFERKSIPGAELLHGVEGMQTTRVFGMVGEFIINFPYQLYPILFVLFAFITKKSELFYLKLEKRDVRLLIVPFFTNLSFVLLISDSDNVMFFMLKNGVIPILFVLFMGRYLSTSARDRSELT